MFVRQKKNKSGSISIQIISKYQVKYKVVKTFGSSADPTVIYGLELKAKQEIKRLESNSSLFIFEKEALIESFLSEVENAQLS